MSKIKTVFMGTPQFALPTLQAIDEHPDISLSGIITQPDRPAGRGKKLTSPPIKEYAINKGIEVFQPKSLKEDDVLPWLNHHAPDVITVVAYGGFVHKKIRELPRHGCINLHPSLLPRYRGAAPMQWTLINGDKNTGNTTFFISKGWDDGDMIYQEPEPVLEHDTYDSLSDRLSHTGAELVVKSLLAIADGSAPRIPQADEGVVHAPMIANEDAHIDWNTPAHEIHNKVRGLCSIPGAFAVCEEKRWKIYQTEVLDITPNQPPGTILSTEFNTVCVAAKDRVIEILELQPAGKKRMMTPDLLRGYTVEVGTQLT